MLTTLKKHFRQRGEILLSKCDITQELLNSYKDETKYYMTMNNRIKYYLVEILQESVSCPRKGSFAWSSDLEPP